jgi:hypothetical protein
MPRSRIRFVIPGKDALFVDLSVRMDRKSEMVAVRICTKKQQMIEGHITVSKTFGRPKLPILLFNPSQRPNRSMTVSRKKSRNCSGKDTPNLYSTSPICRSVAGRPSLTFGASLLVSFFHDCAL